MGERTERAEQLTYAFSTILRFITAVTPQRAEGAWACRLAFQRLPRESVLGPGKKWFRTTGPRVAYIEYDPATHLGRHHRELPPDADPAFVLSLDPSTDAETLVGRLAAIAAELAELGDTGVRIDRLKANIDAVVRLGGEQAAEARLRKVVTLAAPAALLAGPDMFMTWMALAAERAQDQLFNAEIDGEEAAAILLLHELTRNVFAHFGAPRTDQEAPTCSRILSTVVSPAVSCVPAAWRRWPLPRPRV